MPNQLDKIAVSILDDEANLRQHKAGAYEALMKDTMSVDRKDAAKILAEVNGQDSAAHQKSLIVVQDGHLMIDPVVTQIEMRDFLRKLDPTLDQDADRAAKEIERKGLDSPQALEVARQGINKVHEATGGSAVAAQVFVKYINEILKKDGSQVQLDLDVNKSLAPSRTKII